jgi:endonuclease III
VGRLAVDTSIRDLLVSKGRQKLYAERIRPYPFVKKADQRMEANELLDDLDHYPHAFVIACIANRQDRTDRPWLLPFRMKKVLGTFEFPRLRALSLEQVLGLVSKPQVLCRYPSEMGTAIHEALVIIDSKYSGDASNIWAGKPSSADVVYRFLELPGFGIKIATMAANILARTFKVPFSDYYSIDISPDRHVRRVFARLGLTREKAPDAELIYRARSLSPEFPGLLDSPTFEIGRTWCKERAPICSECFMGGVCHGFDSAATA